MCFLCVVFIETRLLRGFSNEQFPQSNKQQPSSQNNQHKRGGSKEWDHSTTLSSSNRFIFLLNVIYFY